MFQEGLKDLFGQLAGMAGAGAAPDDADGTAVGVSGAAGGVSGGAGAGGHSLLDTGRSLIKKTLLGMRERLDYAEFGGAPLLGLNGSVIIAHGRSDARAIANAIRAARRMTAVDIGGRIVEDIRAMESEGSATEREEASASEAGTSS